MFRRQGQQLQPVLAAVTIVTASKLNALFMICVSTGQQSGKYCLGSVHPTSDSDMMSHRYIQRRGVDFGLPAFPAGAINGGGHCFSRAESTGLGARTGRVERRVKELYITPYDVQTQLMIFFNIRLAPMLKTWYTFRKFPNRRGRWIKEPRARG